MEKRIILPGEKIAEGRINAANTFFDGKDTYATAIGTLDTTDRYMALESPYKPVVEDTVVGVITDVRHAGYEVDLNLPNSGFIPTRNVRITLQLGDFVLCKIKLVNEVGDVDLGEVRRLPIGKVLRYPPSKIPRLIGRKSSMIEVLKKYGNGDIMVGNNGYVWISEKNNMPIILKAIGMIKENAHRSGLTDEITNFLKHDGVGD
ncbi:hypothetical protein KKF81_01185 [Candidatus Micrarchaeota archaeon]|nr:hypothetical protein [Candidatus Micrarchaeota archaeon]MBU1165534.1 hypothetical protein [Candidatus Micrarchaeota archaeon]MBU1886523.1 hypothetical protein [Candidatus Micrarchaeota archaeon]